jgi:hypothetical protein
MNTVTITGINPYKVSFFVALITFSISLMLSVLGIFKNLFELHAVTVSFNGFISFSHPSVSLMLLFPVANTVMGFLATLISAHTLNFFLRISKGIELECVSMSTVQRIDEQRAESPPQ